MPNSRAPFPMPTTCRYARRAMADPRFANLLGPDKIHRMVLQLRKSNDLECKDLGDELREFERGWK